MPDTPRRRLTRRVAPPRPTYDGAVSGAEGVPTLRQTAESRRVAESTLRQAPYLAAEIKRILGTAGICLAMLGVLTVIDRMR